MSTTASQLIYESFADLGVTRPGEVLSATVLADALLRFNQRLSAHSIEQFMAQTQKHGTVQLTPGNSRYTAGVGGNLSTATRAEKLTAWRAINGSFQSGGPVVTFEELQAASKDPVGSTTSLPMVVGADTAFPLINFGVFPIPNFTPAILELTYWTALAQIAALTDVLAFPDGWEDFLHFDLAIALLPRYGRQGFNPTVLEAQAQNAKAKIADLNRPASQQAPAQ